MALARLDSAVHVLNSACGEISVACFALSVFSCTGFGKQASLFPCLKILSVSLPTRKKRPSHICAKGECLAVPPFLAKHCFASLSSVTGSPEITYPPRHLDPDFLLNVLLRVILFLTHFFCSGFSNPVRKLPSAPALPDDLSAGGSSSLMAPGAYSSFSSLFSYLLS